MDFQIHSRQHTISTQVRKGHVVPLEPSTVRDKVAEKSQD